MLNNYLTKHNILFSAVNITTKKQALEHIGRLVCESYPDLNYVSVIQALLKRERLGSTCVGHGIAIPHARIPEIDEPFICLITLPKAISFYDDDKVAIDLVFGILAPADADQTQLNVLAELANRLKHKSYRDGLRQADSTDSLYEALRHIPEEHS